MKKADNLQSRRRTDTDYGRGEYTVPMDDILKHLEPKDRKQKDIDIQKKLQLLNKEEKKLKYEFQELKKLMMSYKNKPKSLAKIRDHMIKIRDKVYAIRMEKNKYRQNPVNEKLKNVANILNKMAQDTTFSLDKLQEKYEKELAQLVKLQNNADRWLNKAISAKITFRDKKFIRYHKENKTPEAIIKKKEEFIKAYNMWQSIQEKVLLAENRINTIKDKLDEASSDEK